MKVLKAIASRNSKDSDPMQHDARGKRSGARRSVAAQQRARSDSRLLFLSRVKTSWLVCGAARGGLSRL